ncbi:hypothetical protein ElyMa_001073500 [Elysia marginata]|uniref:Uncharacterized protein n=1 Tax=Elysia marginata TaxID=1093978 RepID=A0AAV4HS35_9GAST|nr:hypothetical protein ElyMa_001073500 [Elysia marginata]
MFFSPSKSSGGVVEAEDAFLDGSCWESARSSWIYMEMEPRQRPCNSSPISEKFPAVSQSPEKTEDVLGDQIIENGSPQSSEIVFNNASYQELAEGSQSSSSDSNLGVCLAPVCFASNVNPTWSSDTSRDHHIADLEFVNGRTTAAQDTEEVQQDGEGDYEEIGNFDDHSDAEEHQYAILSNDNFVLQKNERIVPKEFVNVSSDFPSSGVDKICRPQRSVSLDLAKTARPLLRHSETVQFPPSAYVSSRALPPVPPTPVPPTPASPLKSPAPALFPAPVSTSCSQPTVSNDKIVVSPPVRPAYLPWGETDGVSLSTLGAFSTTSGGGGSLYRIPAKIRKISNSTSHTTNTSTSSSPGQTSTCSIRTCDSSTSSTVSGGSASRVAVDVLNGVKRTSRSSSSSSSFTVSRLPRVVREVFTFLWSDNPDRDPFNTFSVSETDLTTAIAHLESQLSSSVHGSSCNRNSSKTREGVLASLAWTEAPTKELRAQAHHQENGETTKKDDSSVPEAAANHLPFRVQFIMESYCNIYMMR